LNSTNWIDLGNRALATGPTLTLVDSITNSSQRFYRLALKP
jgi:hypothetical protein